MEIGNAESLVPGVAGFVEVIGGAVGIAEVTGHCGLAVARAGLAVYRGGLFAVAGCLLAVAGEMMGRA